jgi:hypothetical protein
MDNIEDALEEQRLASERADQQARLHEKLTVIDFGLQVRQFAEGPIGQQLAADAERDKLQLLHELANLDPDDREERKTMHQIRHKLGVIAQWQEWLGAYVKAGEAAEIELNQGEQYINPET